MSQIIQFGSGLLYLNPTTGNLPTNPTPTRGLTIQDIEIDFSGDLKDLRGQYQFPDDVARGDIKATWKWSMGRLDFLQLSNTAWGDTVVAGGTTVASTTATAIPATPFQITPTPPSSGTFVSDLGVFNASNGFEFTRVTGTPVAGQYKVAAGVYTFSSADNVSGISVIINFAYSLATAGATYQINNQVQGFGPAFEAYIVDSYQLANGIPSCIYLAQCKVAKATLKQKRSDYAMIDLDGGFYAAASGNVAKFYSNVG